MGVTVKVFDLAEYIDELFDWSSERVALVIESVMDADLLIVASPTFKATYTGLLKVFLDRIGGGALLGTLAIPMMVAGAPQHALAVETYLRPLLVELGATCLTPGVCLLESQFEDLNGAIESWWSKVVPSLGPLLAGSLTRAERP
jgi:FMN reductase